jgi:lysophospholipase L1-like esterase
MGSTAVTCTATDVVRRAASCSFVVSVVPPPPTLGVTTILAFGDSITEGEVPEAGEFGIRIRTVMKDKAYPADLVSLLAQRYSAQGATRLDAFCLDDPSRPTVSGIVVVNAGCLGEAAAAPGTVARLDQKLALYHPDVVLLLEGVNDLYGVASIAIAVQGVQTLIRDARNSGAQVLVGTLLPQIAGDINATAFDLIVPFNARLLPAATAAGAHVVDLYSDIATDVTDWISPYDGLHPTEAGYQELARVWFTSLERLFELPASSAATPSVRLQASPGRSRGLP